jgi:hypothetical protein
MNNEKFCDKCGALNKERQYTEDSFETCFKWECKMLNNKVISQCVDWNEHNIPPLSDCPLNIKKTPKEIINHNYKMKNIKIMKENGLLRKENEQLKRRIKRINELSGSKLN